MAWKIFELIADIGLILFIIDFIRSERERQKMTEEIIKHLKEHIGEE